MKKMLSIVLLALFAFSIMSFGLADEEDAVICTMEYAPVCGVDNQTYGNDCMAGDVEIAYTGECVDGDEVVVDEDVNIIATPLGAEVRLLQLQKSIERNVFMGREVLDRILVSDEDKEELELILADLDALSLEIVDLDMNKEPNLLAQDYVALRQSATDLTTQFRRKAHSATTEEVATRVRDEVRERTNDHVERLKAEIQHRKNQYMAEHASRYMERLNVSDEAFLAKIRSGELEPSDVNSLLKSYARDVAETKKQEFALRMKEEETRMKVFAQSVKEKAQVEAQRRIEQMRQERNNRTDDEKKDVRNRLEMRYGDVKADAEIQIRSQQSLEEQERIESRRQEREQLLEEAKKRLEERVISSDDALENETSGVRE